MGREGKKVVVKTHWEILHTYTNVARPTQFQSITNMLRMFFSVCIIVFPCCI